MDPIKQLENYVKSEISAGTPTDIILARMRGNGWTEQDLNSILARVAGASSNLAPMPKGKSHIWAILVVIILLGAISAGVYFGMKDGSKLNTWIEKIKTSTETVEDQKDVEIETVKSAEDVKKISAEDSKKTESVNSSSNSEEIVFAGIKYRVGFEMPSQTNQTVNTTGREWVSGSETVENWTKLITTVYFTPKQTGSKVSLFQIAENTMQAVVNQRAILGDTLLLDKQYKVAKDIEDEEKVGAIVFLYLMEYPQPDVYEANFHRIKATPNGGVDSVIYAERVQLKSEAEIVAYMKNINNRITLLAMAMLELPE